MADLWAALCLCTALVLPPGSPWLHEPALLYPGLMLAAVVPAAWAVWWVVVPPQPLPPEQLLEPVRGYPYTRRFIICWRYHNSIRSILVVPGM